jgi:DNA ligase-1
MTGNPAPFIAVVVLEVAFDGVMRSARHRSGFALRSPRIVRWRTDTSLTEIGTLDRVRELWSASRGAVT